MSSMAPRQIRATLRPGAFSCDVMRPSFFGCVVGLPMSDAARGEPNNHLLLGARRPAAGLRDARRDAESLCAWAKRRRVHQPSFGVSHCHARQFIIDFNGRISGASRHSRQLGVLPSRQRDGISRYRPAGEPGKDSGRSGWRAANGHDPRRGSTVEGRKMLAVGAGTTGSAFLLNHKVSGGAVLHTDFALPEAIYRAWSPNSGRRRPKGIPTMREIAARSRRF